MQLTKMIAIHGRMHGGAYTELKEALMLTLTGLNTAQDRIFSAFYKADRPSKQADTDALLAEAEIAVRDVIDALAEIRAALPEEAKRS